MIDTILKKLKAKEKKLALVTRCINAQICPNDGERLNYDFDRSGTGTYRHSCGFYHVQGTIHYHGVLGLD